MKKTLLLILLTALLISNNLFSQVTINLDKVNGVYFIPCKVNGIPMKFIFDTGATNVTISLTEASFLIKQGLLSEKDMKNSVKYKIANGEIKEGTEIILREIEVSGLKINNIIATVVHEQNAPLLLGMSALSQLGKIEIENNKLIINDFSFKSIKEVVDFDREIKETIDWINSKFVQYQFESNDVKQLQNIHSILEIENEYYLFGVRTQETTKPWGFSKGFLIPLSKINNIDFNEKQYNYWLEIKMKENEKAIVMIDGDDNRDYIDRLEFMLDKSIDNENLRPKLKKAFEYIVNLYSDYSKMINAKEKPINNDEIQIKYTNGVEIFHVFVGKNPANFEQDKEYYWYNEFSKLKSTKGGSGGQLLHGDYKFYDENGNLLVIENYTMGLKDGERKKWDSKGNLIEVFKYEKGKSVYMKYHPKNDNGWVEQIGDLLKEGWIKNSYDEFGNLIAKQVTFSDSETKDLKTKTSIFYTSSNITEEEYTNYMMQKSKIGDYTKFYENGQIEVKGRFYDGNKYVGDIREGFWKWYLENGELDEEENYKTEIEYWENGKTKFIYGMIFMSKENEWIKHGRFYSYSKDDDIVGQITEYEWGELKQADN